VFFVRKSQVPTQRKVTYANFICNIRPQKSETHRVRMTAGGDRLDYPGDASSPTVFMLDAKIHINSAISDAKHGARHLVSISKITISARQWSTTNISASQLQSFPQEVWDDTRYDIQVADDGYVYLEIRRGMCGNCNPTLTTTRLCYILLHIYSHTYSLGRHWNPRNRSIQYDTVF
jgi:hypothetical protein